MRYPGEHKMGLKEILPPLLLWTGITVAVVVAVLFVISEVRRADDAVRESVAERSRVEQQRREVPSRWQWLEIPTGGPKTDDDTRVRDIVNIADALEALQRSRGIYPIHSGAQEALVPVVALESPCLELTSGRFLANCPSDPAAPARIYWYASDGESYTLEALLDVSGDYPCDAGAEDCRFRVMDGAVVSGS